MPSTCLVPAYQPNPDPNPSFFVGQEGSFDFYIKGDRGASPMAASSRPGASSIGEFIAAARFPPLKARSAGPARAGAAPAARACGLQAGTPLRGGGRPRRGCGASGTQGCGQGLQARRGVPGWGLGLLAQRGSACAQHAQPMRRAAPCRAAHSRRGRGTPLARGNCSYEKVPFVRGEPSVHMVRMGPAVARMSWRCAVAHVHIFQYYCRIWWIAAVLHECWCV